jgi:hypothetical protein
MRCGFEGYQWPLFIFITPDLRESGPSAIPKSKNRRPHMEPTVRLLFKSTPRRSLIPQPW